MPLTGRACQLQVLFKHGGTAMTTAAENGRRRTPWRALGWGGAAGLLVAPLVARFPWTASDFVFMAALVGGVRIAFELAARKGDTAYRIGAGAALAAAFLLVWVNAAVGMIGSEDNPYNLLFGGVLAVALTGATVARFRPAGMARAMLAAAAAAHVAVAVGGLFTDGRGVVLSMVLAGLWLIAAAAFRKAART